VLIVHLLSQQTLCTEPGRADSVDLCAEIQNAIDELNENGGNTLANLLALYRKLQEAQVRLQGAGTDVALPQSVQDFLGIFQQELCIQADIEERWENLVRSMAPNCAGMSDVFNALG